LKLADSVGSQAYIFLCSVVGGMIIAFIYDVFRLKRKAVRSKSISLYIEDLAYWVIVALTIFSVIYYSNDGEIRGFIFVGVAIGVVLYTLVLSKIVMAIFLAVLKFTFRTARAIWRILIFPLRVIFKILWIPGAILFKLLKKCFKQSKRISKRGASKALFFKKAFRIIRKKI